MSMEKAIGSLKYKYGQEAAEKLIAYSWSTDWSDYFDDGHEWWGASCWSVYDPDRDRIAVISASNTD